MCRPSARAVRPPVRSRTWQSAAIPGLRRRATAATVADDLGELARPSPSTSPTSTPPPTTSRCSPSPRGPPAGRRRRCTSTATCWRSPTRSRAHVLRPEPDDVFTGTPPIGVHLRPRRPGRLPAARGRLRRCCWRRRRRTCWPTRSREHGVTVVFTAPTAYQAILAAGAADKLAGVRRAVSAGRGRCRSRVWRAVPRRRPGCGSSTASAPPRCCTSSSRPPTTTSGPAPPVARCPATPPRSSTTTAEPVPDGTPGRLAVRGPDRVPLPGRRPAGGLRPRRLERHRRHLRPRRRRLLPVPGAHRRHDRLRRATTSPGPRSRRRCSATRTSSSARWSARPTPSAA